MIFFFFNFINDANGRKNLTQIDQKNLTQMIDKINLIFFASYYKNTSCNWVVMLITHEVIADEEDSDVVGVTESGRVSSEMGNGETAVRGGSREESKKKASKNWWEEA